MEELLKTDNIISIGEIQSFLDDREQRNYSTHTIKSNCVAFRKFILFLADNYDAIPIVAVDRNMITKFRGSLIEQEMAEHSIATYMRALRALYLFLEDRGMIFDNPMGSVVIGAVKNEVLDVLTEDEVTKMLAVSDTTTSTGLRDQAIIEIMYAGGIRREELLSLNTTSLELKHQCIRVFGKGKKERLVPIGRAATSALKQYLEKGRPLLLNDPLDLIDGLWLDRYGKALGSQMPGVIIKHVAKKAGIKRNVSSHTMRRTCATHMLRNGAHPMSVAEQLGHATLNTLSHYLKISITDLMETHKNSKPGE